MKTSALMMVTAILYGLYGLGFMFTPNLLIGQYGGELGTIGAFTTQLYGAMLIGVAVMCWLGQNGARTEGLNAMLMGLFVGITLSTALLLYNQFTSTTANNWAWLPILIQIMLAAGYGYAWFGTPRLKDPPETVDVD
jgi:hypothetical protein